MIVPEQDNSDNGTTITTLSATVESKDHDESDSTTNSMDGGKRKQKDPEISANRTCKK